MIFIFFELNMVFIFFELNMIFIFFELNIKTSLGVKLLYSTDLRMQQLNYLTVYIFAAYADFFNFNFLGFPEP